MSKIKIVGIDFAGVKIVNEFIKISNLDYDSIIIATHELNFDFSNAKIKIHTGKNEKFGLDGGSPQLSENLARKCHDEIFSALNGAEIVICISDFFDDDGEGIPSVIAEIPNFKFVRPFRQKYIQEFLQKLTEKSDYVIQIDFLYFEKFVDKKLSYDIFIKMCERLTAIDIDYFLKNFGGDLQEEFF